MNAVLNTVLNLEYWHVDVFSRHAFRGNGLVVVLDTADLSTAVQQELTREVRQFETVFVSGVDLPGRTARLRVFTEDEELGFAGHPVLGAASVLHTLLPRHVGRAGDGRRNSVVAGSPPVRTPRTGGSMRRRIRDRHSSDRS